MTRPTDTELASRMASQDFRALGELFDRHARSVYGYAWFVTRSGADARAVLVRTFGALALAPERVATAPDMRRSLLALARPLAWAARHRHGNLRWFLGRPSRALESSAPPELRAGIDASPEDVAEGMTLLAAEGLDVHDLGIGGGGPAAAPCAAWRPLPGALRPLALMHARDVLRPGRRWLRRALLAATIPACLLFAQWTTTLRPRLPEIAEPAPAAAAAAARDPARRSDLLDILNAFRDQLEKR